MNKGDRRIVKLVEKFDFYVSIVSNPDGYAYSFKKPTGNGTEIPEVSILSHLDNGALRMITR